MVSIIVIWYQISIFGNIFLKTGDQPERRNLNYIMTGNSNFSSRFRSPGHLNKLKTCLFPCKSVFTQMRENSLISKSNIVCTNCVNWDMMIKVH